jgi:hypothetical protein
LALASRRSARLLLVLACPSTFWAPANDLPNFENRFLIRPSVVGQNADELHRSLERLRKKLFAQAAADADRQPIIIVAGRTVSALRF